MWAACCNWLCFDTEPQEFSQGNRTQAFSNSNFMTAPPVSEISCRACGIRFAASARKNPCMDCKNYYCTSCLIQTNNGHSLCQVCRNIRSTAFDRDELMKLRVKDLRDYLTFKDIPIDLCREKEDLVQLILFHKPPVFSADGTNVPTSTSTDSRNTPGHPSSNNSAANRNGSSNAQGTAGEHLGDSESSDPEENLAPGRRASLSDITCVDDIEALSVRQLKEILARNFVDYKGCCEKWELMERVTRLYNEQKGLQQKAADAEAEGIHGSTSDEHLCKVCMDSPIDCVLLECGHMVTCTKCGKRMSECPICRQYVVRAEHVFRS